MTRDEANMQNAQLSTGPRSDAGKQAASRNALKHGLSGSRHVLVSGEDVAELDALRERMVDRLQPDDAIEAELVDRVVACMWRLRRCYQVEASVFDVLTTGMMGEKIGNAWLRGRGHTFQGLTRYEQALERSMYRALASLRRMREEGASDPKQ